MRYRYGARSLGCECQEVILLVTLGLSNGKSESRVTLYCLRAVIQRVLTGRGDSLKITSRSACPLQQSRNPLEGSRLFLPRYLAILT